MSDDGQAEEDVSFKLKTVDFLASSNRISLPLWLAATPKELERGLMYRRKMDGKAAGMLFVFDKEEIVAMWMKNTYMPLDMIFFDAAGRIVNVKYGAVPESLDIIYSRYPAKFVLEIPAGKTAEYGFTNDSLLLDTDDF